MLYRLPPLVAAVCLSIYWGWVVIKLVKLARKIGKDPNAMPRERVGQWMRVGWYPCILLLLVGLWLAATQRLKEGGGSGLDRFAGQCVVYFCCSGNAALPHLHPRYLCLLAEDGAIVADRD